MPNLMSAVGLVVLLGLAWVLSENRRHVNKRVLAWGVGLQLAFGLFVFRSEAGRRVFVAVNDGVVALVNTALKGPQFVFGGLADPAATGKAGLGYILLTQGLMAIIVFSALIAVLYHVGVMQRVVRAFAWVFTKLMRISGAEALSASSNIFVGIESALTVRPHLARMTRSEFCTILTAGMATVASNVMVVYVGALNGVFDQIAGHLVSASFLSAPAALVMSKLLVPETGQPETLGEHVEPHTEEEPSLFASVITGANNGLRLVGGIAALLIAVVGLIAIADLLLGSAGGFVNEALGWQTDWSLANLLGYPFYPFARLMGIPAEDAGVVAQLLGTRLIATEIPAYEELARLLSAHSIAPRTAVIAAYALCGFAHFPSVAIFVGGTAALVPERKQDLAAVGLRALLAATFACLLTGCVAGLLCTDDAAAVLTIGAAAAPTP